MFELEEVEREQADTFAKLAGFQKWENAVDAAKAGLPVRATLPIYYTVELKSPFGVSFMSHLATIQGLKLAFDGDEATPTGRAEFWKLLADDPNSFSQKLSKELGRAMQNKTVFDDDE